MESHIILPGVGFMLHGQIHIGIFSSSGQYCIQNQPALA